MTRKPIRWAALAAGLLMLPIAGALSAQAAPGELRAAPYYMPLDNEPQDITEAIQASGQKDYI
ncbi:hypothetical protein [Saccharopolyspora mangrovi]|uniref:Uncharacterized protein n=1 Tax=Saccharopolyspora mangrovi TaxID=3082379 RepID=A0ABU6A7E3_9PSEU|nr:hypothetical protein [Saccharopolyspora sp. S2-29]MEB3367438.1 hypothetical protein [Saccharopolyspora sp. S2-29]